MEQIEERLGAAIAGALHSGSWAAVALAFLFGVVVGFTPCVYPLIPLVVGYIGRVAGDRKLNALLYSAAYVVGMALVYSILGLIAALAGGLVGRTYGRPWLLLTLANLFMLLSLWAAGAFELPLPARLPAGGGERARRRGLLGSFAVGAASALVVGPCSTPALVAILAFIAASDGGELAVPRLVFGGAVMFAFALGMGMLLLACGTFSGILAALPRAGRWMNVTKRTLALLILLMAMVFVLYAGQAMGPLGPRRAETLAGVGVALLLFVGVALVLAGSFGVILHAARAAGRRRRRLGWTVGTVLIAAGEVVLLYAGQGLPPLAQILASAG